MSKKQEYYPVDVDYGEIDATRKSRSSIRSCDRYVSLDFETTGFDSESDSAIECAAIRYVNGIETGRYVTFIGFDDDEEELDGFIQDLTGITPDMLIEAPKFRDVLPELLAFIGDDIVLGHNIAFDISFILAECARSGGIFENQYIDTMRLSRKLWPEYRHHRLRDVAERLLDHNYHQRHRAASDAETAALCYEHMKAYCNETGVDMEELNRPRKRSKALAGGITTDQTEFNTDTAVYGMNFVFTGALQIPRREAMQMVVDLGGNVSDNISGKTNFLVLGNQDYKKVGSTGKSSKWRKAEAMQLEGKDISILSESVFLRMIEEAKLEG